LDFERPMSTGVARQPQVRYGSGGGPALGGSDPVIAVSTQASPPEKWDSRVAQPNLNVPALMQAAISHYRAGSLEEARALFERVLRMEPKHPDALHLLGMLWCARGESRKGVQLIRRAIAFSPRFHDALSNLGCVLQSLGRDEEALASFDKALAIRPDSIEAFNNRGNTLQVLGRIEE